MSVARLGKRFVLDDDRHVLQQPLDVRRQSVQRVLDQPLEAARPARPAAAAAHGATDGGGPASRGVEEARSYAIERGRRTGVARCHRRYGRSAALPRLGRRAKDRSPLAAAPADPWSAVDRLDAGHRSRVDFVEHTHVVALDLRGHGLSDSPRSGYDLESLAYDALTVLVANGWGRDARRTRRGRCRSRTGRDGRRDDGQPSSRIRSPALALIDGGWESLAEATGHDSGRIRALDRRPAGGSRVDGRRTSRTGANSIRRPGTPTRSVPPELPSTRSTPATSSQSCDRSRCTPASTQCSLTTRGRAAWVPRAVAGRCRGEWHGRR